MNIAQSLAADLRFLELSARALRQKVENDRLDTVANLQSAFRAFDMQALSMKARAILMGRRKRDAIFAGLDIFSEPAWDILLDLFVAHQSGRPISVTSAVLASQVPGTTGLRWIGRLTADGLLRREADPRDARRAYLYLTESGLNLTSNAVASA